MLRTRLLVSTVPFTACESNSSLVNPVDIVIHRNSIWVSVLANNLVQQYDKKSGRFISSITVTTPTGLAFNCGILYVASQNGNVYSIGHGMTTPEVYLTVTGSIEGIAWLRGHLYVTVFNQGYVGVFKNKVAQASLVNNSLVAFNFRPLGIRALDGKIYITYSDKSTMIGSGYVSVYDPKCKKFFELIERGRLAYPYGLVLLDDRLLVGNRGTGMIDAYNKKTGEPVEDQGLSLIVNDGLMGMTLDDGNIYFVAANDSGMMGSIGVIETRGY